jgi:methane monooxygenase PmoA-like
MTGLSWAERSGGSGAILAPDGAELAQYRWRGANHPYFDQLRPLTHAGVLTNHAPYDHRWHHGLWWSWKFINDILFWEDHPNYGGNRAGLGRSIVTKHSAQESDGTVRLLQSLEWRVDATGETLLHEERSVVASIDKDSESQWILDWDQTWTPTTRVRLEATPWPETPWGGYGGLNYRPARSLATEETILGEGSAGAGTVHGARSAWASYAGLVDGAETDEPDAPARGGVALMQHPENFRHPHPIYAFSAVGGFGFLATAPLMYEPLELAASEGLRLRNRVLVLDRPLDHEALGQAHSSYVSTQEAVRPL